MDKLNSEISDPLQRFLQEWHDESRPCITAHTSGSTGTPKAILLPKEMIRRSAMRSNLHFGIRSSSRLHLALSPDYIAGKMLIVRALIAGCRLTVESPSQDPLGSLSDLTPISLLSLVGAQLPGLIENSRYRKIPEIRHLLLGGAPLNDHMRHLACSGNWTPWESYGMTETASHIALRPITIDRALPFKTLPGISVSLDADDCLVIDLGVDGIFHTNDIAQLIDSNTFFILGRKDNAIITAGHKVFPEQIENIISASLPSGRRFYITSSSSEKWGETIKLVIEGDPCPLPDFHALPLKSFQIPRQTVFVKNIHTTSSGKIIRK